MNRDKIPLDVIRTFCLLLCRCYFTPPAVKIRGVTRLRSNLIFLFFKSVFTSYLIDFGLTTDPSRRDNKLEPDFKVSAVG